MQHRRADPAAQIDAPGEWAAMRDLDVDDDGGGRRRHAQPVTPAPRDERIAVDLDEAVMHRDFRAIAEKTQIFGAFPRPQDQRRRLGALAAGKQQASRQCRARLQANTSSR